MELLIKNATIVDGTGAPAFKGNVGVVDGKLKLNPECEEAATVIDAEGKYVAPGFIDSHSHGDGVYGTEFGNLCKIGQGVTTEICGQCGSTFFPVNPETLPQLKELLSVICPEFDENMDKWSDFKTYKEYLKTLDLACNTAIIAGHSAIRIAVMGMDNRKPTEEEMDKMKALLKEAMEEGALGMSTGLIYPPGDFADTEELIELSKVMAPYDGIYASHLRNESAGLIPAVQEALTIGKEAGVRVQLSHHKAYGKTNWGKSKETLKMVADAIANGQKVTIDQYPYEASMTHFNVLIPPKYFSGGISKVCDILKDPEMRAQIKAEMLDEKAPFDNYYINCGGWEGVFASVLPNTPEYAGMFVSEIAEKLGKDPFDTYFDLVIENGGAGSGIYFSMGEEDLCRIIQDPNTVVGSDGICKALQEKGHPRAWGTCIHAITYFHKEKGIMSLEEIIRKMTSLPAERYMLKGKGVIADGMDADLVIFDYDNLKDMASYTDSNNVAEGLEFVIVNGQIVFKDKKLTGVYPGVLITH
ncbi:MAG: D-aminoacylase [Firmicutes bacterium]|nr:D-aminoacylase [Bacillota bacterium]